MYLVFSLRQILGAVQCAYIIYIPDLKETLPPPVLTRPLLLETKTEKPTIVDTRPV